MRLGNLLGIPLLTSVSPALRYSSQKQSRRKWSCTDSSNFSWWFISFLQLFWLVKVTTLNLVVFYSANWKLLSTLHVFLTMPNDNNGTRRWLNNCQIKEHFSDLRNFGRFYPLFWCDRWETQCVIIMQRFFERLLGPPLKRKSLCPH